MVVSYPAKGGWIVTSSVAPAQGEGDDEGADVGVGVAGGVGEGVSSQKSSSLPNWVQIVF